MKKLTICLFTAVLSAGCSQEIPPTLAPRENLKNVTAEMPRRSLENAVYNEVVGAWMVTHESVPNTPATRTEADVEPTHCTLKIYPRTEEEQTEVETMEDISVSYIPFEYSLLTQEESEEAERSKTRSAANTFTERSPYTVTYRDYKSTGGGSTEPRTFQLPILYVIWPVEKPLPGHLEYVVLDEVEIPKKKATRASYDITLRGRRWCTTRRLIEMCRFQTRL